jgi:hypothetical protein
MEIPDGSRAGATLGIIRAGFLEKKKNGTFADSWKERYFVLTRTHLHRFVRSRDGAGVAEDLFGMPKHSVMVRDITTFEQGQKNYREIEIKSRIGTKGAEYVMTLRAASDEDASAWLESISIAKRQSRGKSLTRRQTISGNYLPASTSSASAAVQETPSSGAAASPGAPVGWDSAVTSAAPPAPAAATATAPATMNDNAVTLISQRRNGTEEVLVLFPSMIHVSAVPGVLKSADILVTLASGARYSVAASKCFKANSKVALEQFEGPGFVSMCKTPPAVFMHIHGSPRRKQASSAKSPRTPRRMTPPEGKKKSSNNNNNNNAVCDHIMWALLTATPMAFWYCAATETRTRYLCTALLAVVLLMQFILSRFVCRRSSTSAAQTNEGEASDTRKTRDITPSYDLEAIVEVVGVEAVVDALDPSNTGQSDTPATPRTPKIVLPPAPPAMELDQLKSLSLTDPAKRIDQLLRNGCLEDFEDCTDGEMGTEESSPLEGVLLALAERICKAVLMDYQQTYDDLPTTSYERGVATPPEAWPNNSTATRHPGALFLDSTLVVGFVRGYAVTNKKTGEVNESQSYKETIEALVKSLSWRIDMRTYTTLEEDLPFIKETFAMWPNLMYGTDVFGHTIMAERIKTVRTGEITSFYNSADHSAKAGKFYEILRVRAQILEAIARKKRGISIDKGFRTHKMLLIIDMDGLSLGRMRSMIAARTAVQMIFSLGSDNYPETVRRIYIVNAPFIFSTLFNVAKGMLDPVTVDKIKVIGKPSKLIAEMKRDNVDYDQMPDWLGGQASHQGVSMETIAEEYVKHHIGEMEKKTSEKAVASAATATATAAKKSPSLAAAKKEDSK